MVLEMQTGSLCSVWEAQSVRRLLKARCHLLIGRSSCAPGLSSPLRCSWCPYSLYCLREGIGAVNGYKKDLLVSRVHVH